MATSSSISAFGRRWELKIQTTPANGTAVEWSIGQDSWLPESLRVTFDINQSAYQSFWYGDISIYNLNLLTQRAVLTQGSTVTLSAGYQEGSNYGIIFQGKIFQWLWSREDVTDYKLTLHCLAGLPEVVDNMVNFQAGAGSNQRDIILRMMNESETSIPASYVDKTTLGTIVLPRGEIVFGSPHRYLSQVAGGNGLQYFFGGTGVVVGDITPTSAVPKFTYSSVPDPSSTAGRTSGVNYTIIDTPQQIPEGVMMRVLLDSRLLVTVPAINIKIDNTVIRQMLLQPGTLPPVLAQDGVYAVGSVQHRGDTRGDEWYSDVTAITNVSGILGALGEAASLHG